MDLPKTYDPKITEDKIYKLWEDSGFFTPENLPGKRTKKFSAAIAPPNITGELHMGHALEHTLEDIIFRLKRMQKYKTLWIPGIDHAGIAAQNVVEKQLNKEGTSRHELGREKFLEKMWEWKEKYGNTILNQFKKLGLSVDWTRTRFTMDEQYKKAVETAFIHYYKKGWIYRGERVINWCIRCATAISDLELNYVPEKGKLYYIKYGPFVLATVRPETKLGDTALAVHPDDKRYKKYIGKEIEINSIDNNIPANEPAKLKTIKIKVVGDKIVDPKFGTGIIKVTPAHDITDFEIGQRHNLTLIKIINEQGKMNENAGIRYQGLKINEAREKIVKDLTELGLIEKIEDYEHNIARCDRCNSVIEPLPSLQWFLKMKNLAKHALKAVAKKQVLIKPEKWIKPYNDWLKNIRDWNISRQLWWGHRLPVWFHEPKCLPKTGKEKNINKCVEVIVASKQPKCKFCNAKYIQSEDVLDTWFSSALWPFAIMGWPNKNKDYKKYYPTDFITSDRGILFLWQVRMIFSGIEFTQKAPFKEMYIHPTVLTKEGKRMSKSLGTGINPLELIEKYGTDALRFGLVSQVTGLQDVKFGEDLMIMGKKFANKVWNISRFIILKLENNYDWDKTNLSKNFDEISYKFDKLIKNVTQNIELYNFSRAATSLYNFIWHEIADKYIEYSKDKNDLKTKDTLADLLIKMLKVLHPFMPFITEEIWSKLPIKNKQLLIVEEWPVK
jgi:valyl-tRNA synthetase